MLRGMPMMVGGSTVVDRRLRGDGDVSDAVVERRGRQQRAVGLHVVVALGFHWNVMTVG